MQMSGRHSDGSVGSSHRLALLQQQKVYKVKTADLSVVCDRHDSAITINPRPVTLSLPSAIHGEPPKKIIMYQPDWLKIGSSKPNTSSTSVQSNQMMAPSPSDLVGKMFAKSSSNASNSSSHDNTLSGKSSQEQAVEHSPSDTPFKKISRKKSVPRHRCNRLNRSLTSALKPSSYPFQKPERRLSRSLPPNSSIVPVERLHRSMLGLGELDISFSSSDDVDLDVSAFDVNKLSKLDDAVLDGIRVRKCLNDVNDTPWVPKGVDFSLTVEAYFYRTH